MNPRKTLSNFIHKSFTFLLFLSISINILGQCHVSGRFIDANNYAIADGIITFIHGYSKNTTKIITDSLGHFGAELPEGTYSFLFEASGYKTLKGSIQFFSGDKTELGDIVMRIDNTKPLLSQGL